MSKYSPESSRFFSSNSHLNEEVASPSTKDNLSANLLKSPVEQVFIGLLVYCWDKNWNLQWKPEVSFLIRVHSEKGWFASTPNMNESFSLFVIKRSGMFVAVLMMKGFFAVSEYKKTGILVKNVRIFFIKSNYFHNLWSGFKAYENLQKKFTWRSVILLIHINW